MNDILTNVRYRGILLIIASIVVAILCGLTIWSATSRWLAIANTKDYRYQYFRGKSEADNPLMQSAAKAAASWGRNDPRYCIYVIDPLSEDADGRLDALRRNAVAAKRHVDMVRDFSLVVRGQDPKSTGGRGDNAKLIAYMDSIRKEQGKLPIFPEDLDSANIEVLRAAVERQLYHAWRTNDRGNLVEACGKLPTIWPTHPATPYCNLLNLYGSKRRKTVGYSAAKLACKDKTVMLRILQVAGEIYKDKLDILSDALAKDTNWSEYIDQQLTGKDAQSLDYVVGKILQKQDWGAMVKMFEECMRRGNEQQANRLIAHARDRNLKKHLTGMKQAISERIKANVILLHGGYGYLAFHVVQPDGSVPRRNASIQLDRQNPKKPSDVTQRGSLVHVKADGAGVVSLKVVIADKIICTDEEVKRQ